MRQGSLKDTKQVIAGLPTPDDSQHVQEGHTRSLTINFNLWSTLGLVYSLTATPFGVGTYLSFSFFLGGSPFYIYGYIFAVCLNIILCVCLAEMAALYPHPSGM
jgi:choline transport protein